MSESMREVLAREATEAEERAEAEHRGDVAPAPGQRGRRPAADPSQVYPVRIPVSKLRQLRRVADRLGIPPTALIRQWVIERLDEVEREGDASVTETIPLGAGSVGDKRVRLGRRRNADRKQQQHRAAGGCR